MSRRPGEIEEVRVSITCPSCGENCELRAERWRNDLQIAHWHRLPWRCDNCGHQPNEEPSRYERDLHTAFSAPQRYWSEDGPAAKKRLTKCLGSRTALALLEQHLDDLWQSVAYRLHKALQGSIVTYRTISRSRGEDRFAAFDAGLKRWRAELIALQESIVRELQAIWLKDRISVDHRHWIPDAIDVLWKPLKNSTLRWIVDALNVWPDATSWHAPEWLYFRDLQIIKIRSSDEWEATQNLLHCLCHAVDNRLSLERAQLLNDARRTLRLSSPAGAPIDADLARSRYGRVERNFAKGFAGLKQKNIDLSKYMDAARLTERQYACFSLAKEYGLPLTEIARRLELSHHSTIAEHIKKAERKIKIAGEAAKRAREAAKRPS